MVKDPKIQKYVLFLYKNKDSKQKFKSLDI